MSESCPDLTLLKALHRGELSEELLESVAGHLEICLACEQRAQQLDDSADKVMAALRRPQSAFTDPEMQTPVVHRPESWPQIPGFEITALLGAGGMSIVFKARQQRLKRFVALKQLQVREPRLLRRAAMEAEVLARLQHANIVQIHEVIEHHGMILLALELIEGGSLAARLVGKPMNVTECATFCETLARSVDYAHRQGVIHRDLKPANILLTAETSAPKITDFGIAQYVVEGVRETHDGDVIGTPSYMSPEQAAGHVAEIGPATDIYSLGVILYEMLTGRVPLQGPTTIETLRLVVSQEPVPPRRLQPRIPLDLETICLKCLEKQPHRRYLKASELADDLQRFRQDQPILARPPSLIDRMQRFTRRHKAAVGGVVAVIITLFIGMAFTLVYAIGEATQRQLAEKNANIATEEKKAVLNEAYRGRIAAATGALLIHDVNEARRQLDEAPVSLRGWEWSHLDSRLDESTRLFRPVVDECLAIAARSTGLLIGKAHGIEWSVIDMHGRRLFGNRSIQPIVKIELVKCGSRLAVIAHTPSSSQLWDETGELIIDLPSLVTAAISPDLKFVASSGGDPDQRTKIAVYNLSNKSLSHYCVGHTDVIHHLTFSPDGKFIATASEDSTARVFVTETGQEKTVLRGHSVKVYYVAFRSDGHRLLTTSADGTVRQWNPDTGVEIEPAFERHAGEVKVAEYTLQGDVVVSAGADRTIRLWSATGQHEQGVWHGHEAPVDTLSLSPDATFIGSQSADGAIRVWNQQQPGNAPLRGHSSYVYPIRFSPGGDRLASGSWDHTVRIWNVKTGETTAILEHPSRVHDLAFSPRGDWLVTGCGDDHWLRVWDMSTFEIMRSFETPDRSVFGVAVSGDGRRIAAAGMEFNTVILDAESGERLDAFQSGSYSKISFSPDDRWLAVGGKDGALYLRDSRSPNSQLIFPGHRDGISSVVFCTNGKQLLTSSIDRTMRLWDLSDPKQTRTIAELTGHSDEIFAMAIHPNGSRLASAGRDGVIHLWDFNSLKETARLSGHTNYVWSLAFSPDGETLASGSGDGTIRLWHTRSLRVRTSTGNGSPDQD